MIEKTVLDYLKEEFQNVFMEEPEDPLEEYIVIEKTGSSVENYIYQATFAIQSYAKTLYKAALLNDKVKKKMDDMIILPNISSSKLNSDYNYTDTQKKKYRYQAVYEIIYHEEGE